MSLHFKREMKRLKKHLIKLSDAVEKQVSQSIVAISDLNENVAQQVIDADIKIDKTEIEMEEECLKLLALHQPVANDLRLIITVLKINSDLERIGDHAVMIAEEALRLTTLPAIKIPDELYLLSDQAKMMLKKCLLSFVEGDLHVARNILQSGKASRIFRTLASEISEPSRRSLSSPVSAVRKWNEALETGVPRRFK